MVQFLKVPVSSKLNNSFLVGRYRDFNDNGQFVTYDVIYIIFLKKQKFGFHVLMYILFIKTRGP